MRKLFLPFIFVVLSSCVMPKIDVIQTGPYFPARKADSVELFTNRNQVTKPYGAIAILHSQRFDCSKSIQKYLLKKARKTAASVGGDAIVYYFDYGENDPYLLPTEKCYFSGLVIKYVDKDKTKNAQFQQKP